MLRARTISSAKDAKNYYVAGLSRGDYYTTDQGQEVVGQWHGKGAFLLGLQGDVRQEQFFALADNEHPTRGGTLTVRQKENRRVGMDFTFNAPKSVSLLYSLTGDARVLTAFRASVTATMNEMEAATKTRVRSDGRNEDLATSNMVWCDFIHTLARPVDGLPDPSLHAHCVAFNQTFDLKEQRWKAAEFHDLKRDAAYYEAAFHARLAGEMHSLGYGIERNGKWWDVAGLSRDLIEKFSRRTSQIDRKAAELGITDPRVKEELGAKTREKKALHLDDATLKAAWEERLSPRDRKELDTVLSGAATGDSGGQIGRITPEETISYAVSDCFERVSVVTEKHLLETALRRGYGAVTPEEVKDAASRAGLLTRTVDGRTLVTTREVFAEEQSMLAFARNGRGICRPLNAAGKLFHSENLNQDQINAVRHVLTATDRVMIVRGVAGSGKTTLTKDAARLIETAGHHVSFFAPSANASRGVLRREGFADADTVARLLVDEVMQERVRGNVLWIDEAGLLSVRDMNRVFSLAGELGCRVVLSGDKKQHRSISRGDALRLLEEKSEVRTVEVKEIVRQSGAYKNAVALLEKGETEAGFRQLDNLGWVVEIPDELRHTLLVKDYLAALDTEKSALVVSPSHREGDAVTEQIRAGLKERGVIGDHDRPFWTLKNLYWTDARKSDAMQYRPGLVVQFTQNAPGITNGERFRVEEVNASGVRLIGVNGRAAMLPLRQTGRFQVYETVRLGLAAGDTIRVTQNYRSARDGYRLDNGTLCKVKAFTDKGELVLANGRKLGADFAHFTHGYVATSYASQGSTVDRVLIAHGSESFPASSREQFYVSASRGKKQARIYTDNKEALQARIRESGDRASATELVEGAVTARMQPVNLAELRRGVAERYRRLTAKLERIQKQRATPEQEQEAVTAQERSLEHGREVMGR